MPNGILTHWQFSGVADLAQRCGGGYAHVTTRANLQVREIEAKTPSPHGRGAPGPRALLARLRRRQYSQRHGLADRGHRPPGADRHPPLRREWHFHILNERALYGCRASFNVGFDGGGIIPVLEDTKRHRLPGGGGEGRVRRRARGVVLSDARRHHRAPGLRARDRRGGRAKDATKVADAIVRVFIDTATAPTATKARLKYVIDRMGIDQVLSLVEDKLGRKARARWRRCAVPASSLRSRRPYRRAPAEAA